MERGSNRISTHPPLSTDPYWTFYAAVAERQLTEWLDPSSHRVLDVSADGGASAATLAAAGRCLVRAGLDDVERLGGARFDAVVAERCALSASIATELAVEALAATLRPGGRLLLSVESLVLGLSQLADAGRWAELADAPAADVVLIPGPGDQVRRCFWPADLEGVLEGSGFAVEWVRPRTVISGEAVARALAGGHTVLEELVETEVAVAREREGESIGIHLVASAVRR